MFDGKKENLIQPIFPNLVCIRKTKYLGEQAFLNQTVLVYVCEILGSFYVWKKFWLNMKSLFIKIRLLNVNDQFGTNFLVKISEIIIKQNLKK